jgi:hypothetical protein
MHVHTKHTDSQQVTHATVTPHPHFVVTKADFTTEHAPPAYEHLVVAVSLGSVQLQTSEALEPLCPRWRQGATFCLPEVDHILKISLRSSGDVV